MTTMKRLDKPIERGAPTMKRLDTVRTLGMRPALGFLDPAKNPLTDIPEGATPEQEHKQIESDVLRGFKERAKAEAIRFAETTRTDYYFCVVFEHGDQANAFLQKAGYPDQNSMFVDGTVLAKALDIEIPPSPFKLRALKTPDRSLNSLVTMIPSRSEIKRMPALPAKSKTK